MDRKLKHLDFIQGVINRLSTNSFLLKGWSVILISALFALSAKDSKTEVILLAFIPALVFWGLDGYFLALEREYRKLYDIVRAHKPDDIDFSMKIPSVNDAWCDATFSKTLIVFHGALIVAILIVMLIFIYS
ncbi:MAG: hypothetical protein WC043_07455 [Pseudobdellovibrionaceae bacterium]